MSGGLPWGQGLITAAQLAWWPTLHLFIMGHVVYCTHMKHSTFPCSFHILCCCSSIECEMNMEMSSLLSTWWLSCQVRVCRFYTRCLIIPLPYCPQLATASNSSPSYLSSFAPSSYISLIYMLILTLGFARLHYVLNSWYYSVTQWMWSECLWNVPHRLWISYHFLGCKKMVRMSLSNVHNMDISYTRCHADKGWKS